MGFTQLKKQGLAKCLFGTNIDPDKFSPHIAEIEPGKSSHAFHRHNGIEMIYVFYGRGIVEVEAKQYPIGPNEVIVIDATKSHGLTNTGTESLRYMVIKKY